MGKVKVKTPVVSPEYIAKLDKLDEAVSICSAAYDNSVKAFRDEAARKIVAIQEELDAKVAPFREKLRAEVDAIYDKHDAEVAEMPHEEFEIDEHQDLWKGVC